jgi:hypothetical protein
MSNETVENVVTYSQESGIEAAPMTFMQDCKYAATVIKAEYAKTPNKGTKGLFLVFNVAGIGQIEGAYWLSEKAKPYTDKTMHEAFGFRGKYRDIGTVVGSNCEILVKYQDYNGKTFPRAAFINATSLQSVDDDEGCDEIEIENEGDL